MRRKKKTNLPDIIKTLECEIWRESRTIHLHMPSESKSKRNSKAAGRIMWEEKHEATRQWNKQMKEKKQRAKNGKSRHFHSVRIEVVVLKRKLEARFTTNAIWTCICCFYTTHFLVAVVVVAISKHFSRSRSRSCSLFLCFFFFESFSVSLERKINKTEGNFPRRCMCPEPLVPFWWWWNKNIYTN